MANYMTNPIHQVAPGAHVFMFRTFDGKYTVDRYDDGKLVQHCYGGTLKHALVCMSIEHARMDRRAGKP